MWVLVWLLQVLTFFVALKLGQILFWNVRRSFYVHPWIVEIVVGALVTAVLQAFAFSWWTLVLLGVLIGVIRGDQEEGTPRRQLL